jgi:predicted molibdopterin-dependent oxidoreductase YjgC
MFKRFTDRAAAKVTIFVDGRSLKANATDSVTAAMLGEGIDSCRTTTVSGRPRAPYCMMGACFDCLVIIDGRGSRQGCMTRVRCGMSVETQFGKRELGR